LANVSHRKMKEIKGVGERARGRNRERERERQQIKRKKERMTNERGT